VKSSVAESAVLLVGQFHPNGTPEGRVVESRYYNTQFIDFLQEELHLSASSIAIALRRVEQDPGPLPMILWEYGLVSLEQLERIFDWLEK
jgi:Protein of unknown function (DUF2949)